MLARIPRISIAIVTILACLAPSPLRAAQADQGGARGPELLFTLHRGFLIVVEGHVGSMEGLTFLLDTGTARTVVDTRVARVLRLQGSPTHLFSFNSSVAVEEVVVPSIRLGPIDAASLPLLAADLSGLTGTLGVKVDAIAGLDVLRGRRLGIDYTTRRLFFGSGGRWDAGVPFDRHAPYPVVRIVVDATAFRVLIDTGAEGLILHGRAIPPAWRPRMRRLVEGSDLAGDVTLRAMRADWIWLGLIAWRNQLIYATQDAGPARAFFDGVLGPRALGISQLQFDFEHMMLRWNCKP